MTELVALVGTPESLRGGAAAVPFVELAQGFVLVPVGEPARDAVGAALADDPDAAADLSRFLAITLGSVGLSEDAAASGPIAYLELDEYQQSGFVVEGGGVVDSWVTSFDGAQSQTPEGEWAFNRALRRLGVRAGDGADECAAVGLTRYLADLDA